MAQLSGDLLCVECEKLIYTFDNLYILTSEADVVVRPEAANRANPNIYKRDNFGEDRQFCPTNIHCASCGARVGRCHPDGVTDFVTERPSAKCIKIKVPGRLSFPIKKWESQFDLLEGFGVKRVTFRELCTEDEEQPPSRKGKPTEETYLVDVYNTPASTLTELLPSIDEDGRSCALRNYQLEMIEHSLQRNSLVCLPTGSGKTRVATGVIAAMLHINPRKVACFLVKTNALAEQQSRLLMADIKHMRILTFSGQMDAESKKKTAEKILNFAFDVLVITCSCMISLVERGSLRFEDICCLVLDEAHHARKNDDYKKLMNQLYKGVIHEEFRPLILGLTASPVDEKPSSANLKESLEQGIEELAQTLGCLQTYPLNNDPYKNGISQTMDFLVIKIVNQDEDQIRRKLDDYLLSVIRGTSDLFGSVCPGFLKLQACIDRDTHTLDTNQFRGKLRDIQRSLDAKRDEVISEQTQKLVFSGYAIRDHLNQILAIHEINKVIGHEVAIERMLNVFEEIEDPSPGQQARKQEILRNCGEGGKPLYHKFYSELQKNPRNSKIVEYKLSAVCKKLIDLLKKHFEKHKGDSRVLVFVDMRRTAKKLCSCLQEIREIRMKFNPQMMVGRGIQADGFTIDEQQEILSNFRKGLTRLLVTTTILEEGLDVPSCNLVIRLLAPQVLRQFIQSRGRACRFNGGEFHIFCDNKEEANLQQSFINCVAEQPKIVQDQMKAKINRGLDDKADVKRKILNLDEDSGRLIPEILTKKTMNNEEGDLEDEEMEEMLKLMTEIEMTPDQTEDLRFLDEFEPTEVSLSLRFVWWPQNPSTYEEEIKQLKLLLPNCTKVELEDWKDIRVDSRYMLLGTSYYPEVRLVSTNARGVEEMSLFEKIIIGNIFMTSMLAKDEYSFWVSVKTPYAYFPRSTAAPLELSEVNLGSLVGPQRFVNRLLLGQPAKIVAARSSDSVCITIKESFKLESSFGDIESFVIVDQIVPECSEQDAIVRIHLTFSQPPRMSILEDPTGHEERRNFKRVTHYTNDENRRIFGKCLTYQIHVVNLKSATYNTTFSSKIRQFLRVLESCGKTIYYAPITVEPAWLDFPPESKGIDPKQCIHHASETVNYAMKCVESAKGFMYDRLTPSFFKVLNMESLEKSARALYKLVSLLNRTLFCDYTKELEEILHKMGSHLFRAYLPELKDHKFMKRVVLSPTHLIFYEPDFVQINRTVRENGSKNFLRLSIKDENGDQLTSLHGDLREVIHYVKTVLEDGIRIGPLAYHYLASSNSQLRGHSCYFIKDDGQSKAEKVRSNQGNLSGIKNVGKYLSRMGLGFSTSSQTIKTGNYETESDIERNDHNFSDGIGYIAQSLAAKVSEKLHIDQVPSAFQIRLGGCKGMITVWPDQFMKKKHVKVPLIVRESMFKYASDHKSLEVLEFTRPLPLHLNHQVIMLLNNVGVPDHTFLHLLKNNISQLGHMFSQEKEAKEVLSHIVNAQVKELVPAQFRFTTDLYFRQLMMALYRVKMRDLRERSRVLIDHDKARVLHGVLDETGILKYGQVFIQYSKYMDQPNVEPQIVMSKIVIMKNPCIHPGDVRVFQGVRVPELCHLVDCVVFPQQGHRPHPNELSGSDLDGDLYHCIWDPQLLPTQALIEPMNYNESREPPKHDSIGVKDMIEYTCSYIEHDNLGMIDNTHKALADQLGLESKECLELAVMHAKAVDAPKTEDWQKLNRKDYRDLLKRYPDFMMKHDKPSYKSEKVLGQMFRECDKYMTDCLTPLEEGAKGVIMADKAFYVSGCENFHEDAKICYQQYCEELTRLMHDFGVKTEAELISGYIRDVHSRFREDVEDVKKIIRKMTRQIFETYRKRFEVDPRLDGPHREGKELEKASAWYHVAYDPTSIPEYGAQVEHFFSFPWILSDRLAKIYVNAMAKHNVPINTTELTISTSVVEIYFDLINALGQSYDHHHQLCRELNFISERFGMCILTGLSSMFLFDQHNGEVCVLLMKNRKNNGQMPDNKKMSFRLLERLRSTGGNAIGEAHLNPDNLHLRLRLKKHTLPKKRADVTSDTWSLFIWSVIKSFIFANIWLHPVLRLLCSWIRTNGLVGGRQTFIPDYVIPLLFIHHCLQRNELKVIDFDAVYKAYENFLQDTRSAYPLGSPAEWKDLMTRIEKKGKGDRSYAWEINPGRVGGLLSTFMSNAKDLVASQIDESLQQVLASESWIDLVGKPKMELVKAEMEKASHRLEMHISAAALLSRVTVERLFSLDIDASREMAGNEDAYCKTLFRQSGARIDIQSKMDEKRPGMIIKGQGTEAELYVLDQKIRFLNHRAKTEKKMSKRVKVLGMKDMPGAHNLLIDGSTTERSFIHLEPYFGIKYPQHDCRNLYVARLFGSSTAACSSEGVDSDIADSFRKHFARQVSAFHRRYTKEVYGDCELQIKFGRTYIVSPPRSFVEDPSGLTVHDLLHALENRQTREIDPTLDVMSHRARSQFRGKSTSEGYISSSFVSSIVLDEQTIKILQESMEERLESDCGVKMVVHQVSGSLTAVYDKDLKFVGLESSPFRWIVSDVKRHCHGIEGKAEGDECDIRFLYKTQMKEFSDLDENAQSWGLKNAVDRAEDGKLVVVNDSLDVQLLEEYATAVYRMKRMDSGIRYNAVIRDCRQFTRRIQSEGNRVEFSSEKSLVELRLLPNVDDLLNSGPQNDTLDAIWKLAFQYSNVLKSKTQ